MNLSELARHYYSRLHIRMLPIGVNIPKVTTTLATSYPGSFLYAPGQERRGKSLGTRLQHLRKATNMSLI
jgi:hypothetical protein